MKVYLDEMQNKFLQRDKEGQWHLYMHNDRDFDSHIRELDKYENNFVESTYQTFVQNFNKTIGA